MQKTKSFDVSPDDILETDIRTINGWSAKVNPTLPADLRNQWCICITTNKYKNIHSESLLQILIGCGRKKVIMTRGSTGTSWGEWGKLIIS